MPLAPVTVRPAARSAARPLALVALTAAVTVAACGGGTDPFAPVARAPVSEGAFVVYPFTGSAPVLPSAVNLAGGVLVRPTIFTGGSSIGEPNFDLAFDRDASGRTVIYSPRWLVAPPGGVPRAGMQVLTQRFDEVLEAPSGGYVFDSLVAVLPGQVVAIQTAGLSCNGASPLHAKLRVDSIVGSAIHTTIRVNPNCGFRSFVNGTNGLPAS